ncbi:williams-Beuren syndrome critical region protein 22 [Auriculariales sp. MPI-PUGE-AT-0066]|nr:williams-Beuren syndrome critical region protein 22 [Auriculariales sp. MPI-PUGE-AT-0066]
MSRPELQAPPEIYYGDAVAKKYTTNTRVQRIQAEMTTRALELLNLGPDAPPSMLLDIGCGSGLSGELLDEAGHIWVGMDIAPSMLEIALEREVEGDLFLHDIGQGFPFRAGTFDGAISISVIQWLLNAETSSEINAPPARLARFFRTLHALLRNPSRAILQWYPSSDDQIAMVTTAARKAGFGGGVVVDYPNSKKARKVFLCLFVGSGNNGNQVPQALDGDDDDDGLADARFEKRRQRVNERKGKQRKNVKDRDWIIKKKEKYRTKGKEGVPRDSKYTGRKRKTTF